MVPMVRTLALATSLIVIQTLSSLAGTINVTGTGHISVKPDQATFSAGVVTVEKTAEAALAENSRRMSEIYDRLAKAGVDRKHIQTSQFSIHPNFVYPRKKSIYPGEDVPQTPQLANYTVRNTVTVIIKDFTKTGKILQSLVNAGANELGSIQFGTSRRDALLDDARKLAVKDARRKADLYAQSAGVSLGSLKSINEQGSSRPSPVMARASFSSSSRSVPVSGGELSITATINATWFTK
ncbi:MAG: SIMPL domain-containing protein [Cohaesibacteraceae bacterium]|nr:SIMPL domain-containing protein [Cohaesibacteraceae bacterium]